MIQGTINGYGERCGNADLISLIANLQLKLGKSCLPPESIRQLTNLSHYISDVANVPPINSRPFVVAVLLRTKAEYMSALWLKIPWPMSI